MKSIVLVMLFIFPMAVYGQVDYKKVSIRDCLLEALQSNFDIKIESYRSSIAKHGVTIAEGAFDPLFTADIFYQFSNLAQVQQFELNDVVIEDIFEKQTEFAGYSAGLSKRFLSGTTVGVFHNFNYTKNAFDDDRNDSIFTYETEVQINQSLLRNFGIDVNASQINIEKNNLQNAKYARLDKILKVFSQVQLAYLDLVFAIERVKLQQQVLKLSEDFYDITLSRVKAGSLHKVELAQAERDIAEKTDQLLAVQQAAADIEDSLKKLMRPSDIEYYQNVKLIPVNQPIAETKTSFNDVLKYALKHRADVKQTLNNLKSADIDVQFRENQLLPKLDFTASFGIQGQDIEHPNSLEQLYKFDEPTWTAQLSLEIPIGNRVARGKHSQSILQKKVLIAQYKNLESVIIWEIRRAIRRLKTAKERIVTARQAKDSATKQLALDRKKYRAGTIFLFQLQNSEAKLTSAKVSEISALIEKQKAIVNLETSQWGLSHWLKRYSIKLH